MTLTGMKLLLYGVSKTGKTRLSATFPKPLLIMGTERGTKSIATHAKLKTKINKIIPVYTLYRGDKKTEMDFVYMESAEWFDELYTLKEYNSFVIDTAGGYMELCLKEALGVSGDLDREFGMATMKDWAAASVLFKKRIKALTKRVDDGECNWCIIAHERNFAVSDDDSASNPQSERIAPHVGADLGPKMSNWLNGIADSIGQTFIRQGEVEKKIKKPSGKVVVRKSFTGKMEYCLRIGAHSVYITGFRTISDNPIPDVIVNPTFDKVAAIASGDF